MFSVEGVIQSRCSTLTIFAAIFIVNADWDSKSIINIEIASYLYEMIDCSVFAAKAHAEFIAWGLSRKTVITEGHEG